MKVFVIGSLSCEEKIKQAAYHYEQLGHEVEYVKRQPTKSLEELVVEACYKIYKADLVVIVTKEDGSIGDGTTYEKVFAEFVGTEVKRYYEEEGAEVHYGNRSI